MDVQQIFYQNVAIEELKFNVFIETDLAITQTESVVKVLSEHMVGKVLSYVTTEYAVTEAVQEYIYDFVHTMYHAMSEHEHQVIVLVYNTCYMIHVLQVLLDLNIDKNKLEK